jgi:hypothetical protein
MQKPQEIMPIRARDKLMMGDVAAFDRKGSRAMKTYERGDDERAGGSNTTPTAKRREDVQHEYRQHEAKSAAAAVSGIRGDTLSRLPRQGRLWPRASRRETTRPMTRQIRQGTQPEH